MRLHNNLYTKNGWEIIEDSFAPEQLVTTGSNFMIGNGYLGYRGTFAEWEADRYVACIVSDTYDAVEGNRRELCNVPNGLFARLSIGGKALSMFDGQTQAYHRTLDMRYGLHHRAQTWENSNGAGVKINVEKFASYDNLHLLLMRYNFQVEREGRVEFLTGIDGNVWSIGGEHFERCDPFMKSSLVAIEAMTGEMETQIDVVEGLNILGPLPTTTEIIQGRRRILRRFIFYLDADQEVTIEKIVAIYTSNDTPEPRACAMTDVRTALQSGYQPLKKAHQESWDAIWEKSDVQIEGDLEDQTLARFNIYHNIIATPMHADLPIGARGLSCQVYQGAAFWDQEIFNLPMFLYTQPDVARSILKYRYDTLDGARGKAKRLGYYGAFYAWTSGKTGDELFPDHFFTNVLTGRKMRNHFNDWQIHISPDIVYALWQYYAATDDWNFIVDYGAEIAFEVAQFLVSRIHFKMDKKRYEFIRLLGPDEYHENVDNNAFTNYQARFALEKALVIYELMRESTPEKLYALCERLGLSEAALESWQDIVDRIYLPQPDPDTLLIEQFDGFFELEDVRPKDLRERLLHPEEYWGWPNGVAVETQVQKQADVLQLLALHDLFTADVVCANYDYYEPRTEHGSSLSPSVHSLIASRTGYAEEAYRYFQEAATIDLYNASKKVMSGGSFLGGIHTAACGAVWQMIVFGFAGFTLEETCLRFQPALPKQWESVAFKLIVRCNVLEVEISSERVVIRAQGRNEDSLYVTVRDQSASVAPGETRTFM